MIDPLQDTRGAARGSTPEAGVWAAGQPWEVLRAAAIAVDRVTALALRYGLVVVIAWIGAMKFTAYEAAGIEPFIANSPLMAWLHLLFGIQGASNLLGVVELLVAALLAARPLAPRAALLGGGLAAAMFLTTLTFLVSTPGWEPTLGGFPALSAMPGQFLLKDLVLLAAALWCIGDAARALPRRVAGAAA